MAKKSTLLGLASLLVMPVTATSNKVEDEAQARRDAIRVNALDTENEEEPTLEPPGVDDLSDNFVNYDDADQILIVKSNDLDFQADTIIINENSEQLLKDIKNYVTRNNYNMIIIGHTDTVGTSYHSEKLSLKRVENVKNQLISLGLSSDRVLELVGKGDIDPLVSNDTEEGKAENRRIEFRLYKRNV